VDQFIRVEAGLAKCRYGGDRVEQVTDDSKGKKEHTLVYDDKAGTVVGTIVNSESKELPKDHVLLVPGGTWHNIWNDSNADVNIYTVYSFDNRKPPHKVDTVQETKEMEKYEEKP